VLLAPPADGAKVLIIGGGPIAFAVLLGLRMLGQAIDVSLVTQVDYQCRMALVMTTWSSGATKSSAMATSMRLPISIRSPHGFF
jgi:hypothetical protein